MKKEDIINYSKILAGIMMISPLVFGFWVLELDNLLKAFLMTGSTYLVLMAIAIPMFNYLEHGCFGYWITEASRKYKGQ